jgi:hypothetical protein
VPIGYIGFHFDFTVIVEDDMQASVAAVILSKFLVQIVLTLCGGEDGSSVVSPQGLSAGFIRKESHSAQEIIAMH